MNIPKSARKPPGRRLIKRLSLRTKWILLTIVSVLLICYGLVMMAAAVNLHNDGSPTVQWMLLGLYALAIISAGILGFGQGIRFRILLDIRREINRATRRLEKKIPPKKLIKKIKSPDNTN